MISILICIAIVIAVIAVSAGIFHVRVESLFRFLIFVKRLTGVCFGLRAMLVIFIVVISIICCFVFSCPLFECYFEAIILMRLLLAVNRCSCLLVFISCI